MATAVSLNASESHADINMTPLIDVMLVLLIIFIITIPIQTNAIRIDNPTSRQRQSVPPPEVIDLAVDFDGSLSWNNTQVDRATMQTYISQEATRTPQPEVHISVDRLSRYEVVAQTLADLQRLGLRKIGFVNNELFR
ncbi:MAG: biopolymer transporter ExbD [Steroidobacteraceae bacterium]